MTIPSLQEVDLSYNRFDSNIPQAFLESATLKRLRLNHNLITGPLNSIAGLTAVELVHMQSNQLRCAAPPPSLAPANPGPLRL